MECLYEFKKGHNGIEEALDEIVLNSKKYSDEDRAYFLSRFRKSFIGKTIFADNCKIENPDVIQFDYNPLSNVLEAYVTKPIKIINKSLGYTIYYDLVYYKLSSTKITYLGYSRYEQIKGGKSKQRKWKQNRLRAYNGSKMHFIRAARNGTLYREGYVINLSKRILNPERPSDSLINDEKKHLAKLKVVNISMTPYMIPNSKNIKINTVFVRMSPIMETLTGIMIAILIFYSGKLALKSEIEIGNFFSFLAAMMLAYQPVRALSTINITLKQGLSAANRILPIIDHKNTIIDLDDSKDLNITDASIKFNKLNFKYNSNEENVLKNINIDIAGGKMTSLVGHSGSGKSTILNLIPRFYDAQSGDILIDNQSIYKVKIKSLRDKISLVSQDTTLFDDTIKNNIKYAKDDVSDEEVISAAKFSYASEFIEQLPNKYETIIGENGIRLSGGEKQRLSIARAMIKKSPIILLDEATSSLDSETESKIQDALKILTKDKTTIVIAHRLSTILSSDQIYIIDSGNVVANGKHDELLNNSELYKNFYEKQIRKE